MVFAKPCSHDKSCQNLHPDTRLRFASSGKARICPQLKSCNVTDFWLRDSLYRDSATALAGPDCAVPTIILYRDSLPAPIKLVPPTCGAGHGATRVMLNKICTWMAKTAPIPSLPACGSQAGLHPRCSPPVGGSRGARRDSFLAKVPAPSTRGARCLRRVTQPPHIAGPL